jgi:hypothetical protein
MPNGFSGENEAKTTFGWILPHEIDYIDIDTEYSRWENKLTLVEVSTI